MDAVEQIQSETTGVLGRHLARGQSVALLDFPSHQNAGDSLIYLGELAYLQRMGVRIDYACDIWRYDPDHLRKRVPNGPILLQGGGNFGDRWWHHQEFRERVITDFPDRKIVQLPQSIEFIHPGTLEQTRRTFGQHPDLTVLTRDHRSTEFARREFAAAVEYCPDMAFGVGRLERSAEVSIDVVMVLRQDSERVDRTIPLRRSQTVHEIDWGLSGWRNRQWRALKVPDALAKRSHVASRLVYPLVARCYETQASLNVRVARRRIGIARVLVTDRLHAAVLGGLSGIPVVALDNCYGKVSSSYDAYLYRLSNVVFAQNGEGALEVVRSLLT